MSRCKFHTALALAACLLSSICAPSLAARLNQTTTEDVPVVTAVAPIFPRLAIAANVEGAVVVLVRVDAEGKVISADVVSGHPLLRSAASEAATRWRFTRAPGGPPKRSMSLTFIFTLVLDATEAELATTFSPPYNVKVKSMAPPRIDVNERPTMRRKSKT